jgi:hypothetical protein
MWPIPWSVWLLAVLLTNTSGALGEHESDSTCWQSS